MSLNDKDLPRYHATERMALSLEQEVSVTLTTESDPDSVQLKLSTCISVKLLESFLSYGSA
jgi:hypothetical protein